MGCAVMGGGAAAVGPVIGGLLVTIDWRWVFLVNIPVGVVAIVAGSSVLPRTQGERGPFPDFFGALLLTIGIGALTLARVKAKVWGWGSPKFAGSAYRDRGVSRRVNRALRPAPKSGSRAGLAASPEQRRHQRCHRGDV